MPSAPGSRRLLAYNRDDDVERALDWADVAAMLGDFDDAVAWLDRASELLGGPLPDDLQARRREWVTRVR